MKYSKQTAETALVLTVSFRYWRIANWLTVTLTITGKSHPVQYNTQYKSHLVYAKIQDGDRPVAYYTVNECYAVMA